MENHIHDSRTPGGPCEPTISPCEAWALSLSQVLDRASIPSEASSKETTEGDKLCLHGLPCNDPKSFALTEGATSIPQGAVSGMRDNLPQSLFCLRGALPSRRPIEDEPHSIVSVVPLGTSVSWFLLDGLYETLLKCCLPK